MIRTANGASPLFSSARQLSKAPLRLPFQREKKPPAICPVILRRYCRSRDAGRYLPLMTAQSATPHPSARGTNEPAGSRTQKDIGLVPPAQKDRVMTLLDEVHAGIATSSTPTCTSGGPLNWRGQSGWSVSV